MEVNKMVVASHYIFRDVLDLISRERIDRLEEVCDGYSRRYQDDQEFQEVCDWVNRYLHSDKSNGELNHIKERLGELIKIRRLEVSGGNRLWFVERR